VRKIQNAGLGEHAIRDLNDSINKLLREKYHWNRRIRELGGKDYNKEERKAMVLAEREGGGGGGDGDGGGGGMLGDPGALASMGLGLKGSGGYRYFGAARDLPGVKELFARHASKATKRKRGDIYKYITPDYYGLRDEEDGVLLELEGEMAADKRGGLSSRREEYREAKLLRRKNNDNDDDDDEVGGGCEESSDDDAFFDGVMNGIPPQAAVPSREVVARVLLQKKKEALLDRFA
jgi:pre-mRNA-splicing factor ISY1